MCVRARAKPLPVPAIAWFLLLEVGKVGEKLRVNTAQQMSFDQHRRLREVGGFQT